MWCDAPAVAAVGNNIQVQLGGTPMVVGDGMNISIYRLNDGDEVLVSSQRVGGPFAAGAILLTQNIAPADWYRVDIYGDDDNITAALGVAILNNAVSEIVGATNYESGWILVDGNVAYSSARQFTDPTILAVLVEKAGAAPNNTGAEIPWFTGKQFNGDLLPTSINGDSN